MAEKNEVQFIVSVVDQATAEIRALNANLASVGAAANRANDEAKDGFDKAAEGAIGLNQALELVKKGAHLLAEAIKLPIEQFRELFDISSDLVREYDKQFQAQTKLRSILKTTGQGGEEQAQSLIKLASALQDVTRFDDEAIVGAQGLALAQGAQLSQIPDLTKAALDLASAYGKTAEEGMRALTRSMETGNVMIDRQHVFVLRAADAQGRLAEAVQRTRANFGGLSQQLATGGAGALDQLNNAFSDLKETLGEIIAKNPAFQAFVQTAKDFTKALDDFFKDNPKEASRAFGLAFSTSFQLAVSSVDAFIEVIATAGEAISGFLALLDLALPEGKSPLGKLRTQLKDAQEELRQFQEVAKGNTPLKTFAEQDAFGGISVRTAPALPGVTPAEASNRIVDVQKKIDDLKAKLASLESGQFFAGPIESAKELSKTLEKMVEDARKSAEVLANPQEHYNKLLEDAVDKTGQFAEKQKDTNEAVSQSSGAWEHLQQLMKDVLDPANDLNLTFLSLRSSIDELEPSGTKAIPVIEKQLERLRDAGKITQKQFDDLANSVNAAFSAIVNAAPRINSAIGAGPGGAPSGGGGASGPTGGGGGGGGGAAVGSGLDQAAQRMAVAVIAAAGDVSAAARELVLASNDVKDGGTALQLGASFLDDASLAAQDSADALDEVASAQSAAADKEMGAAIALSSVAINLYQSARRLYEAANKLAGQPGPAPFASGGIVTSPLLGRFEGKVPEAVIPLDDRGVNFMRNTLRSKRGGGDDKPQVVVNVDVENLQFNDRALDELAGRLWRRFGDKMLQTVSRAR